MDGITQMSECFHSVSMETFWKRRAKRSSVSKFPLSKHTETETLKNPLKQAKNADFKQAKN